LRCDPREVVTRISRVFAADVQQRRERVSTSLARSRSITELRMSPRRTPCCGWGCATFRALAMWKLHRSREEAAGRPHASALGAPVGPLATRSQRCWPPTIWRPTTGGATTCSLSTSVPRSERSRRTPFVGRRNRFPTKLLLSRAPSVLVDLCGETRHSREHSERKPKLDAW